MITCGNIQLTRPHHIVLIGFWIRVSDRVILGFSDQQLVTGIYSTNWVHPVLQAVHILFLYLDDLEIFSSSIYLAFMQSFQNPTVGKIESTTLLVLPILL